MTIKSSKTRGLWAVLFSALWISQAVGAPAETPLVQTPPMETFPIIKSGSVVGGFQLSARVEETTFAPATPIVISVALKNMTDKTLTTVVSSPEYEYKLSVTDTKGNIMPETRYAKSFQGINRMFFGIGSWEVSAGQELKAAFVINRFFDMTTDGEYLVRFTRNVSKLDGTSLVPVESGVVRVKVDSSVKSPAKKVESTVPTNLAPAK